MKTKPDFTIGERFKFGSDGLDDDLVQFCHALQVPYNSIDKSHRMAALMDCGLSEEEALKYCPSKALSEEELESSLIEMQRKDVNRLWRSGGGKLKLGGKIKLPNFQGAANSNLQVIEVAEVDLIYLQKLKDRWYEEGI